MRRTLGAAGCYLLDLLHGYLGLSGGSLVKNPPANAGEIAGSVRSPGEGNGNLLQYPCLENSWTEEPGGLQSVGSQKSWT